MVVFLKPHQFERSFLKVSHAQYATFAPQDNCGLSDNLGVALHISLQNIWFGPSKELPGRF